MKRKLRLSINAGFLALACTAGIQTQAAVPGNIPGPLPAPFAIVTPPVQPAPSKIDGPTTQKPPGSAEKREELKKMCEEYKKRYGVMTCDYKV